MLVGRLTRDPEVRTTPTGKTVTSISLATSHTWKGQDGQKQEKSEFHNLVLWGRVGEIAGQYLIKGQEAYFEGRLETRNWDDKDSGKKMYRTEVVVENMQLGNKPQGASRSAAPAARAAAPAAAATAAPAPKKPAPVEEDIPTINLDDEQDDIKIEDVPF